MNKWLKTATLLSTAAILGSAAIYTGSANAAATGKTIHWTDSADLTTMDGSKATDVVAFNALTATTDGLYRNDKNGNAQLALAKSVDTSDDGLTWTFHLRDGLKWSNGDPLTAKDFVYSWQRTNDPKTASEYAYLFSGIKNADAIQAGDKDKSELGVQATDDTTLVVTLEKPMPQLKAELTMATFAPQNQAFVEKAGKKYGTAAKYTISSGPYKLQGWTGSNNKYSLIKNDSYYDAATVRTKKITIQTIKDQNTGYSLYKAGDIDYTTLSADQVKASKNRKDFKKVAQASTFYIQMNQKKVKLFKDANARRAISYAINRQQLADKVLTGQATAATSFTSIKLVKDPNTNQDFAKSSQAKGAIKYDKAKAQKLWNKAMKAAGKKKLTVQLLTDDTDNAKKTAQFLQSNLQKLKGLKITIKTVPFKQRLQLSTDKNFDMVITAWGADYADPSTFLDLMKTGASNNNGSWSNETYDKALDAAANADVSDTNKRYEDLATAEKTIEKDAGVAPIYYQSLPTLQRSSVSGVISNSVGSRFDWKYAYKK